MPATGTVSKLVAAVGSIRSDSEFAALEADPSALMLYTGHNHDGRGAKALTKTRASTLK